MTAWKGEMRRASDQDKKDIFEILHDMQTQQVLLSNRIEDLTERMDRHGKNYENLVKDFDTSVREIKTIIIGDGKIPGLAEKIRNHDTIFYQLKAIWVAIVIFSADLLKNLLGHIWK